MKRQIPIEGCSEFSFPYLLKHSFLERHTLPAALFSIYAHNSTPLPSLPSYEIKQIFIKTGSILAGAIHWSIVTEGDREWLSLYSPSFFVNARDIIRYHDLLHLC